MITFNEISAIAKNSLCTRNLSKTTIRDINSGQNSYTVRTLFNYLEYPHEDQVNGHLRVDFSRFNKIHQILKFNLLLVGLFLFVVVSYRYFEFDFFQKLMYSRGLDFLFLLAILFYVYSLYQFINENRNKYYHIFNEEVVLIYQFLNYRDLHSVLKCHDIDLSLRDVVNEYQNYLDSIQVKCEHEHLSLIASIPVGILTRKLSWPTQIMESQFSKEEISALKRQIEIFNKN